MKPLAKNPWIAGIANFIIPGVGYLYNGKRIVFGALLLLWTILAIAVYFTEPQLYQAAFSSILVTVGSVVMGIALAFDAYQEAKQS